ncbi:1-pyrroline-5-carboxylate dehydrogenase [Lysinibacillus sphaericus]
MAELGGKHLKKISLEMGGKNAVIVMEDADLQLATEAILWSAFGTAGQRCTACSRVIVHKDVKEELENRLLEAMQFLTIGDGLDETVKIGPVINRAALEKINHYVQIGKQEGASLLTGGVVAQMIGDGAITERGVFAPETIVPGETYIKEMAKRGVVIKETSHKSAMIVKW